VALGWQVPCMHCQKTQATPQMQYSCPSAAAAAAAAAAQPSAAARSA
jgi:hypothetical protein